MKGLQVQSQSSFRAVTSVCARLTVILSLVACTSDSRESKPRVLMGSSPRSDSTVSRSGTAATPNDRGASKTALGSLSRIPDTLLGETLVSTEGGTLQYPSDMAFLPDGNLAVLDFGPPAILVIDPESGEQRSVIGRRGKGPGELFYPLGLIARGDTLATANIGNGRFEAYVAGKPIRQTGRLPSYVRVGRVVLNPDGSFLLPTAGRFNTLVRWFNRDGTVRRDVGSVLETPDTIWRFVENREAVLTGKVPRYFRNGVLAAAEGDTAVWLAYNTEPSIERHDLKSGLTARFTLPESLAASIRSDVLRRNQADTTNSTVIGLEYFADLKFASGFLWALTKGGQGTASYLVCVDAHQRMQLSRLQGTNSGGRLVLDSTRRRLLVSSMTDAAIMSFSLPIPVAELR